MKPSRILLITILSTGALYVASFVALGGSVPTIDSNGQEIVDWFSDNGTRARIYAWTAAFISMNVYLGGAIGFLWVAGVVRWALQRIDSAGQPERKHA